MNGMNRCSVHVIPGFEFHAMLALTGSMRSWLQFMEFIACSMPCETFCQMMDDIRFHDGKELPFEKYEIINTPEYYVNA